MGRFADPLAKEIGLRLRRLREERHEQQVTVAAAIGIERASLSNIERGRHHPALRTILGLADYFNVSLEFLVLGEFYTKTPTEFSGNTAVLWEWLYEHQKHHLIIQMAALVLENTSVENEQVSDTDPSEEGNSILR